MPSTDFEMSSIDWIVSFMDAWLLEVSSISPFMATCFFLEISVVSLSESIICSVDAEDWPIVSACVLRAAFSFVINLFIPSIRSDACAMWS